MDNKELIQIILEKYKEKDVSELSYDFKKKIIWIYISNERKWFPLFRNELCDEIGDKTGIKIWDWVRENIKANL